MTARPARPEDLPILKTLAAASPYPYPDLDSPLIESITVVVDDTDTPVAAFIAKRLIESYLILTKMHPAASLYAISLLHDAVAPPLRALGYTEVEAYVPPQLARTFGKRLERTFGWVKNWQSWTRCL